MVVQYPVKVTVVGSSPIAPAKYNGPCSVIVACDTCNVSEGCKSHTCPRNWKVAQLGERRKTEMFPQCTELRS